MEYLPSVTTNAYGREWLASRLTSTITRLLTGILDQKVEVQFIVEEGANKEEIEDSYEDENSAPVENPAVLSLQAEYQSIYDEFVQPHRVMGDCLGTFSNTFRCWAWI